MAVIVLSGQKKLTTAGTAVALTTAGVSGPGKFLIKSLPAQAGVGYLGNDGANDVTSSNGLAMTTYSEVVVVVSDLSQIYLDGTTESVGVTLMKIAGAVVGVEPPAA